MFCPQCGQQSSDEIRFCPRCGLSLVPHAALLAAAHHTTTAAGLSAVPAPALTKRRVSTRRASKLLFFSIVLIPIFIGFGVAVDGPEPLLVPFTMFLVGLAWLVYARLFGDDHTQVPHDPPRRDLAAGADRPALSPPQFAPASSFNQPANTAEMVPPPSVTENSTRLLDKDA
jgi:hypothetical protein